MTTKYHIRPQADPVETFARNSVAYQDGVSHAVNVSRQKTIALVGTSDGAIPAAAGEAGEHVKVQCISGSYMYGTGVTSLRVYKSSDGTTWARTTATQIVVGSLHALSGGRLLGFSSTQSADPDNYGEGWYSDDGWETVSNVTFGTARTATSVITNWNLAQHGSTIIVNEYGASSALGGKYIYRSIDNGVNFTKVADLDDQTAHPYHWHTVHYHSGTGRWVAFFGDTQPLRGAMVSADDGVTWTLLSTPGNYMDQPIVCYDTGDATRLLMGCDGATTLGWVNVLTGEIERIGIQTDQRATKNYCFAIGYYAGVYYAGGFDNTGSSPAPAIWVSTDLVNWSVYHKFTVADGVYGSNYFVGAFGGKLHIQLLITGSALRTFSISPANVRNVGGTLIEPAVTNLANTADLSSFEANAGGWTSATSNWTVERYADPYLGSYGLRSYGINEAAATKNSSSPNIVLGNADVGKKYVIQCRMKATRPIGVTIKLFRNCTGTNKLLNNVAAVNKTGGKVGLACTAHGFVSGQTITIAGTTNYNATYVLDATTSTNEMVVTASYVAETIPGTATATPKYVGAYVDTGNDSLFVIDKNWKHIRTRPFTVVATDISNFKVHVSHSQGPVAAEVFMDCFQVMEVPITEWMIGGTTKVLDLLTETITTPAAWTDIFAVETIGQPDHYEAAADLYIKTWKVGADELQLFWDVSESKITIQRNAETVVASAAQEWHPHQVIKFALRADASGLTLDIQNGRAKEQLTDSALAALLSAEMTMIYGNVSSAAQFPGIYFDGSMQGAHRAGFGLVPFKLTDAEIVAAFNLAPTHGLLKTDGSDSLLGDGSPSLFSGLGIYEN